MHVVCGTLSIVSRSLAKSIAALRSNDLFWKLWVRESIQPRHDDELIERIPGSMKWRYYARMHAPVRATELYVSFPERRSSAGHRKPLQKFLTLCDGEIVAARKFLLAWNARSQRTASVALIVKRETGSFLELHNVKVTTGSSLLASNECNDCIDVLFSIVFTDNEQYWCYCLYLTSFGRLWCQVVSVSRVGTPNQKLPTYSFEQKWQPGFIGTSEVPRIARMSEDFLLKSTGELCSYFLDIESGNIVIQPPDATECLNFTPSYNSYWFKHSKPTTAPWATAPIRTTAVRRPLSIQSTLGDTSGWVGVFDWSSVQEPNSIIVSQESMLHNDEIFTNKPELVFRWFGLDGERQAAISVSGRLFWRTKNNIESRKDDRLPAIDKKMVHEFQIENRALFVLDVGGYSIVLVGPA